MHKIRSLSIIFMLAAVAAVTTSLFLGCDDPEQPEQPTFYTVAYAIGDGASGTAPAGGSYEAGATFSVAAADGITKAGYTFGGWNDGTTTYQAGATYTMPAAAVTFTAVWTEVGNDPTTYTVTYNIGEGATGTAPAGGSYEAGATFALPLPTGMDKEGYGFGKWSDGNGEYNAGAMYTMPAANVVFTAVWIEQRPSEGEFRVEYMINLPGATPSGSVSPSYCDSGDTVTVKDGRSYAVGANYLFMGWTTERTGTVFFSDGTHPGQYFAGDRITVGTENITLYAQWARRYTDVSGASNDGIYIYEALIGRGIGAATLVRSGKPNKLGFVTAPSQSNDGYAEVQFMFDDSEGGDIFARLVSDTQYRCRDEAKGVYLMYDYVARMPAEFILAADGYGSATVSRPAGEQLVVEYYGLYEYDALYDDYTFVFVDIRTGNVITDGAGNPQTFYFALKKEQVGQTEFDGYFIMQGYESGSYLLYGNGMISYTYRLDLNGYGGAKLFLLDPDSDGKELLAEGRYEGTDRYDDYSGEWRFVPENVGTQGFEFILSMISAASDNIAVYIEYDETLDKTFRAEDGGTDTLYLNGYGGARYSADSQTFEGYCAVNDGKTLVTFVPYIDSGDGTVTAGGKMYFDIDYAAGTFVLNTDGYILDGTVLTEYRGESSVISVPSGVTEIAARVFVYDSETGFGVTYVTIPESVQRIGKCAFENNGTLHRATFLSDTPIAVDFTAANNPFRWPAGDFVIVVPEGSVSAYKTAWSDCPYAIKGSEEVNRLVEFEIENGVLVRYNKQPDTGAELELTVPEGVSTVAAGVFRGLEYIKTIDLNGVTTLGNNAFENCVNLEKVVMENVETVGNGAFFGCEKLNRSGSVEGTLEIPNAVTIGENAFQSCEKLRVVRVGGGISSIGTKAFTECNVYTSDPPIFLELTGSDIPQMAEKVFFGNIAFRIKVKDIATAKKFYASSAHADYCTALYIESGDEKGLYMDGSATLNIDGRAVLMGSGVMLYEISGETVIFYEYDRSASSYKTVSGSIADGTVSFAYEGKAYSFTRVDGPRAYVSDDGAYTLVCDPALLDPERYAGSGFGTVDVTLNGVAAELYLSGYQIKIVRGFTDSDGKKYDIKILLDTGNVFTYTKTPANYYLRDITSEDGSKITLHFTGTSIYVFGELKQAIGTNSAGETVTLLPASSTDYSYSVTQVSDTVFTFDRRYLDKTYTVTLTLSADKTTFTYAFVEKQQS